MTLSHQGRLLATTFVLVGLGLFLAPLAEAQHYQQTNLVSDQPGATTMDPNLINPWGLSRSSTSPWWVANNGTGTSTLYNAAGAIVPLVVTVPPSPGSSGTGVPTGTVYNGTTDFQLTTGNPARFLFATEDGTISGWNPAVNPTQAVIKVSEPGAVFKGMAIASDHGSNFLYAANFVGGQIEVFDASFNRVHLRGGFDREHFGEGHFGEKAFDDDRLPRGYGPFNVQNIGGDLYVAFAKTNPPSPDQVPGPGNGFVDVFSPSGRLLRRLQHGPWLNAPWGLALAPGDFGAFSHHVLVGQFGSGEIAVYDVATGAFVGEMRNTADVVLTIPGLWDLSFGNGAAAGPLNTLFFTAGPDDEAHGVFGTLTAVAAEQLLGNGF
jgi:uncharacterized protein (TIGR03118 family)